MDSKKLAQLKKVLETRRAEAEKGASRNADEGRAVQQDISRDAVDRANDTYIREFNFSLSSSQTGLLQMINGALGRIADGSFGMCLSCGQEINIKRLEAVPWTHYCLACQTKMETEDNAARQTGT